MKTLFVESLAALADDERAALEESLRTLGETLDIKFILMPANVFVSQEKPAGYVFEETEQEEGEDAPRITRRLVFPTKADLYDFLASPEFQGLEAEAVDE